MGPALDVFTLANQNFKVWKKTLKLAVIEYVLAAAIIGVSKTKVLKTFPKKQIVSLLFH